ncbi:MAG: glycosyltransferase [Bacteroidales bacterium]
MTELKQKIFICLPAMNEGEQLPSFLEMLANQSYQNFELHICVNQPESYNTSHPEIVENNQKSIEFLKAEKRFKIQILDRSTPGLGWNKKNYGVGWARKVCMDSAAKYANYSDLLVCADADTFYPNNYLETVALNFEENKKQLGLAVPYYHPLTSDEDLNRHILRYEIYMRIYALNMWSIKNPYAYTAVGSSMVCTKKTYEKIGGMTPHKSGEDFYFLQKIRKAGILGVWNNVHTQPAARYSDRVFFGTGPALIKGANGDWTSYPIYHHSLYSDIKDTFDSFSKLYTDAKTNYPLKEFLQEIFSCDDPFAKLRENAKTVETFQKACIQKIDGLRILQYLKNNKNNNLNSDENNLIDFFTFNYKEEFLLPNNFSFNTSDIEILSNIRDFLVSKEHLYLQKYHKTHA